MSQQYTSLRVESVLSKMDFARSNSVERVFLSLADVPAAHIASAVTSKQAAAALLPSDYGIWIIKGTSSAPLPAP